MHALFAWAAENVQLEEMLSHADAAAQGGSGEISRLEDELARAQVGAGPVSLCWLECTRCGHVTAGKAMSPASVEGVPLCRNVQAARTSAEAARDAAVAEHADGTLPV